MTFGSFKDSPNSYDCKFCNLTGCKKKKKMKNEKFF